MTYEISCGAVLFTRAGGALRFVVIHNRNGSHGFPKGHRQAGETEEQTALREIAEEVGLAPALLPGFRAVDEYPLPGKPGVTKRVVWFLAEFADQPIVLQESELDGACLATYAQACAMLEHEGSRRVLFEAARFLAARPPAPPGGDFFEQ